ncbi:helix-turn-helix domain-containing protein [uncultured Vagococcus sp.]|uniref:helix-turn-helix domain-containing protein n=1 Tax=uncultured Vagococcus sp. TaxID=189676 RepID=UPI0037DC66CA
MGGSPYYCSFKFHQITGVSIKRYRLLYITSERLAETDQRIIEIAFHAGYTSQSALSRGFKEVLGVTPWAFRGRPRPLQTYIKISLKEREEGRDGYFTKVTSRRKSIL